MRRLIRNGGIHGIKGLYGPVKAAGDSGQFF